MKRNVVLLKKFDYTVWGTRVQWLPSLQQQAVVFGRETIDILGRINGIIHRNLIQRRDRQLNHHTVRSLISVTPNNRFCQMFFNRQTVAQVSHFGYVFPEWPEDDRLDPHLFAGGNFLFDVQFACWIVADHDHGKTGHDITALSERLDPMGKVFLFLSCQYRPVHDHGIQRFSP